MRSNLGITADDPAWAYLKALSASVAQRVAAHLVGNEETAHTFLEVLAAAGRVPRCSVVPELARRCASRVHRGGFDRAAFVGFADALMRATEKRRALRAYLNRLPYGEDRLPDATT